MLANKRIPSKMIKEYPLFIMNTTYICHRGNYILFFKIDDLKTLNSIYRIMSLNMRQGIFKD